MTYCNSDISSNGIVRAIHGGGPNKGKDFFAACGTTVWHEGDDINMPCSCATATGNSTASIAVGDIDGDGVPEIVVPTENDGLVILSARRRSDRGDRQQPMDRTWYTNPTRRRSRTSTTRASPEIVVGNQVFTLDHDVNGKLEFVDHFDGGAANPNGLERAKAPSPAHRQRRGRLAARDHRRQHRVRVAAAAPRRDQARRLRGRRDRRFLQGQAHRRVGRPGGERRDAASERAARRLLRRGRRARCRRDDRAEPVEPARRQARGGAHRRRAPADLQRRERHAPPQHHADDHARRRAQRGRLRWRWLSGGRHRVRQQLPGHRSAGSDRRVPRVDDPAERRDERPAGQPRAEPRRRVHGRRGLLARRRLQQDARHVRVPPQQLAPHDRGRLVERHGLERVRLRCRWRGRGRLRRRVLLPRLQRA